jgi:hypothetical protein|tara:strand:- start:3507 stop:3785 length:279 start_codon:yes stop_codon:yes gene_type:complete
MRFEDLKFKKQTHGGVGATVEFKDVTVSVQAGAFVYSTPREDLLDSTMYSSFEVAVFDKDGRFITENFMDNVDEVSGWTSKEQIDELLKRFS